MFNQELAVDYTSQSQKIRVMSENWLIENAYCVRCGNMLSHFKNNKPVGDVYCQSCHEEFELKSKKSKLSKLITDGAYSTMIEKIENNDIPNFFYLNYLFPELTVNNLVVIPKHYFTKDIIIKRKPLSETASRKGWIGCNIDISLIPVSGMIYIVKNGNIENKNKAINDYNKMLFLREQNFKIRGWLLDIIKCIEQINKKTFSLNELYFFEKFLKLRHPSNNNIRAKIRNSYKF